MTKMLKNIMVRLEWLRQCMHETAMVKGISHPDVLSVSQKLDNVINEYYALFYRS